MKISDLMKMIDSVTEDDREEMSLLVQMAQNHPFKSRDEVVSVVSRCLTRNHVNLASEFFLRIDEYPSVEKVVTAGGIPLKEHAVTWKLAHLAGRSHEAIGLATTLTPAQSNYKLAPVAREDLAEIGQHARQDIPKIIHQVWIGPKPCPSGASELWQQWCDKYGYTYKLWTASDIGGFESLNSPAYESFYNRRLYAGAVDVVRAEILYREGGLYIDMDMFPIDIGMSVHDVFNMTGMICLPAKLYRKAQPYALFLTNSIMGSSAGHPVLRRYRDAMTPTFQSFGGNTSAWWAVGGCLLTSSLKGSINVIDPKLVVGAPRTKDIDQIYGSIRRIENENGTAMFYSTKFW